MGRLDGKVALISGGARGMGRAEAELFAAEGARVAIGDVRDAECEALAKEIGPAALALHLDVTNEAEWSAAVAATTALAHPGHGGAEDPRGLAHYLGFHGLGILVLLFVAVALGSAVRRARERAGKARR